NPPVPRGGMMARENAEIGAGIPTLLAEATPPIPVQPTGPRAGGGCGPRPLGLGAWPLIRSSTHRTTLLRERHLYRTFSSNRHLRFILSPWLFVLCRWPSGRPRNASVFSSLSSVIHSSAFFSSGTPWYSGSFRSRAHRHRATFRAWSVPHALYTPWLNFQSTLSCGR